MIAKGLLRPPIKPNHNYFKNILRQGWLYKTQALSFTNIKSKRTKSILKKIKKSQFRTLCINSPIEFQNPREIRELSSSVTSDPRFFSFIINADGNSYLAQLAIQSLVKLKTLDRLSLDLSRTCLAKEGYLGVLSGVRKQKLLKKFELAVQGCQTIDSIVLEELVRTSLKARQLRVLNLDLRDLNAVPLETLEHFLMDFRRFKALTQVSLDLTRCLMDFNSMRILLESLSIINNIQAIRLKLHLMGSPKQIESTSAKFQLNWPNVREFELTLKCSDDGFELFNHLEQLNKITYLRLDMSNSNLKDQDVLMLAKGLSSMYSLHSLKLDLTACSAITENSLFPLFTILSSLKDLTYLSLVMRQFYKSDVFTQKALNGLEKSLSSLSSLKNLSLSWGRTSVQENAYLTLSKCLVNIQSLEKLQLHFENAVNCSDQSFEALSLVLPRLKHLFDLKLSFQCCVLGDESLLNLADCLKDCKALRSLGVNFLYYGKFSPMAVSRFRQRVYNMRQLKSVIINENPRTPVKANQNLDLFLLVLFILLGFMCFKYYFMAT